MITQLRTFIIKILFRELAELVLLKQKYFKNLLKIDTDYTNICYNG